jgi:hypothetical protein
MRQCIYETVYQAIAIPPGLGYTYRVLNGILAAAGGAIGGAWRQRTVGGAVAGALLGLTWYFAVGYPAYHWNVAALRWAILGFLAVGSASAALVGPRRRKWLDVPLDGRIGLAVSTGFLVQGCLKVSLHCPELRRILQWRP